MAKNPRVAIEIPPLNKILGKLDQGTNPEILESLKIWNQLISSIKNGTFRLRPTWSIDGSPWMHVPHPTEELRGSTFGYMTAIGQAKRPSLPVIVNTSRLPPDLPTDPTDDDTRIQLTARMPNGMPPWWRACVVAPPAAITDAVNGRIGEDGMGGLIRVLLRELEAALAAPPPTEIRAWDKIPADLWARTLESTARAFAVAFALAALRVQGSAHADVLPLLHGITSGVLPIGHHEVSDAPLLCIFLVA
jgi:hypothetical protein